MAGRKAPIVDDSTRPFWEAARERRLVVQRLPDGALQWPPRPAGLPDWDAKPEWVAVSGRGVVWSYSVVHRSVHPFPPVPYVMAVVELEEGPFMATNIVAVDPAEVAIGMKVEVEFEPLGDDLLLPVFRPAS